MTVVELLLTNTAYGYPRGALRRYTPYVLAVVHQTSNTATARQERDYANRAGSNGPSATYYVDKDGSAVHAVDGTGYAAWGSGDIDAEANTSIPTVARMVAERARGIYVNEAIWEQIEGCGTGIEPWTDAQFETAAQIIAARSKAAGLAISRSTVLAHADINGINRSTDPWPASTREARMARLIDRAREIVGLPDSSTGGDMGRPFTLDVTKDADPFDAIGTAKVKGPNHSAISLTGGPLLPIADGLDLHVVTTGHLNQPYDSAAGDRQTAVFTTIDGEFRAVLRSDVTFTPLANPLAAKYDAARNALTAVSVSAAEGLKESA